MPSSHESVPLVPARPSSPQGAQSSPQTPHQWGGVWGEDCASPKFFYFPAKIVRFSAFWVLLLQFGCLYYTQNKLMVHRFAEPTPMGEADAWSAYSWIRACGI